MEWCATGPAARIHATGEMSRLILKNHLPIVDAVVACGAAELTP